MVTDHKVNEVKAPQRSKDWFNARKGRVTASSAGAILGLNPWRSGADVMRAMVREKLGYESEFAGNIATEYGTRHENDALQEFSMREDKQIYECGFFTFEDWLGGSPDGLIDIDDACAEVKCPFGMRKESNTNKFKPIREQMHYFAQIQICMYVTKRLKCYFVQWCPLGGLKVEIVHFDALFLADVLPKLKAFHDEFLQELLLPTRHLTCKSTIVFPENKLAKEYMQTKEVMQAMKKRQDVIIKELCNLSGDKAANFGDYKLIKTERKGSIAYKKVVDDLLKDVDVETYRGNPSVFWSLR